MQVTSFPTATDGGVGRDALTRDMFALASYLLLPLPPWIPLKKGKDNWQTTAWGQSTGLIEKEKETPHVHADDHF